MSQNSYTSSIHQKINVSCPTLLECRLHRSILDEFQDGVCVINLDTYEVLYLNEAARKIYNRPLSECTENPLFWLEAIVPEEREILQNTLATFLNTEGIEETHRSMPVKYHILHPSGEKRLIHHKFWLSGNEEKLRIDSTLTDITELNQVEESLRSSQRFIEQIAELSPSVLYVYDLGEQRNAYINREVGETLGYTAQEMMDLGSSVLQTLMHPEDFAKLGAHYQQFYTAKEGDAFEIEYRMRHRNGDWRWLISRETLFSKTADGQPKQLIGTATDITDRKRAEEELAQWAGQSAVRSEISLIMTTGGSLFTMLQRCCEALVEYLDAVFVRVWVLNTTDQILELTASAGQYTHLNGAHAKIGIGQFKIGRIAQQRQPLITNDVQNDPNISNANWARQENLVAFAGYPLIVENRLIGVLALFSRHLLTPNHLDTLQSIVSQIALGIERKQAETALQESEARYRAFADAIPDLMFRQSADGVYLDFKAPSTGDLAVPPEVFLGKNMAEVLPPALSQQIQYHIDLAIATGTIQSFDYQIASLNGKLSDYEARIAPVGSNEVIGVIQDISHRKRSEAALRKSQQQLQQAQRIAHIGSWEFDAATQKISWSEELFRIYGLDPAQGEPAYTEFLKTFDPDDTELFLQAFNRALTEGIAYDIDYRFFRSDGSLRYLNARGEAVCNEQGDVVSLFGTAMDITERKETEAALREREAFLRTLYENVEQAIFVIDVEEDGTFRYRGWNPAGERMCGFSSSEGLGKTPQELFGEEIGTFFNQRCNSCLAAGTAITYEENLIHEGVENWVLTTLNPLRNESGRVYRILGTGYDITLGKQTEAALRDREAFLRMLYENVEQSIFVIDVEPDGTFRNQGWNPAGERICGIPSEEAEGKTPQEVFGDQIGGILEQHYTDCVKAGSLITYEESFMNNGVERWSLTSLNPLRDELGRIYRILGTAYDITYRKQAEITLAKQEQFLRGIWEGVAYQIYVLDVLEDQNFRFAAINPAVENHIMVKAEQLIGKTLVEAMPAEMVPVWQQRYLACVEAGVTISFEEKVVHSNQEIWYLSTLTPLRNTADEISQIIITAIDISDRKRIELALQQSEAQYRDLAEREVLLNRLNQLIRNSLELEIILQTFVQEVCNLFAADQSLFMWYRRDWNPPAWEIVYEAKKTDISSLLGVYPVEYIPQLSEQLLNLEIIRVDDVDAYSDEELREFFQKVGYQSVISLPILTAEGDIGILTCSCSKTKRSWLDSEIEILHAICDQLTIAINQAQLYIKSQKSAQEAQAKNLEVETTLHELQKAQSNLIQAEKMSSLGQLVAGVAHEINNPVNFIYGNLTHAHDYVKDLLKIIELYQQYYPQPAQEIAEEIEAVDLDFLIEDLPKLLASMRVGSERIKEIVKSLRTFSRLDESDMKAVDLHESIDSTLMILHHRLKPKSDYPGIQIIKNYAELPEVECYAGQLNQVFMNLLSNAIDALEERDKSRTPQEMIAQPSTINITTTLQQKRVKICISDNGIGIKDEVISRIFDPFYTTKPVGQGTGLGLSISYQIIVDRHRGNLYCTSAPGQGTEFIIEIPQQQQRF